MFILSCGCWYSVSLPRGAVGSSEVVAFPVILIFIISNMEFTHKHGIKKYKDMSNLLKANSWLLW